ncbi:hypothetical protein [Xenorhabdus bovienii]|uniref:Uncharacterized protein n=1 Tax=Xenorhabdus bovienii str. kraussei Becker Underwood TaxID=1398204 RepID=A0A077PY51_XENBV|nr:hypothetical protein [Xenorhabdus bovienii]CDH24774.1 hypothetical protein; putative exported protein [Xenorhabdus bovienii str. kraussei Becker Underwood]
MKYLVGLVMILFSVTAFSKQNELDFKAWEKKGSWGIYSEKPDGNFKILEIKDYRDNYLPAFSYLIKVFKMQDVDNHYCLIGYKWNKKKDSDEHKSFMVFWKTANHMIDWNLPDGDDENRYKGIIYSKPLTDMSKYVVPYKEAEGGQAMWAKEGVIQMMDDCELNGQDITIKPSEVR